MSEWIEIFRSGKWTSADGKTREFDDAFVSRLAASYDPKLQEAPVVLGHPKDDAPAFGWVEGLKAEGGKLFAKLRDVSGDLRQWVRDGLFRHRSIAIYGDLEGRGPYLRHLGILGAAPPAVKGMPPLKMAAVFGESEPEALTFEEKTDNGGNDVDDKTLKQTLQESFQSFGERIEGYFKRGDAGGDGKQIEQQIAEAVSAAKQEVETAFSEKLDAVKQELATERERTAALASQTRSAEVEQFAERLRGEGKITPAMEKAGLITLCAQLANAGVELEFSEGEGDQAKTVKRSGWDVMQQVLDQIPVQVEFGELTGKLTRGSKGRVHFNAPTRGEQVTNIELAARAKEIQLEKEIDFGEALKRAREEMAGQAS